MVHALALLQQRVEREEETRVAVVNAGERTVFALLDIWVGNARRRLDIRAGIPPAGDEIAFQSAYPPDGKLVLAGLEVQEPCKI